MKKYFFLFAICFMSVGLVAQKTDKSCIIKLKTGLILKGELVSYTPGESVILRLKNGLDIQLDEAEVKKITGPSFSEGKPSTEKNQKKWYFQTSIYENFGGSNNTITGLAKGIGVRQVAGIRLNRYIGVGLGTGIEWYGSSRGDAYLPVFADVKGYFLGRSGTFLGFQGGYGFITSWDKDYYEGGQGGYSLFSSVGYQIGLRGPSSLTLELGWQFQEASLKPANQNWWLEIDRQTKIKYQRLAIRVGIEF